MSKHPAIATYPSPTYQGADEVFIKATGKFVGAIFARPYTNDFILKLQSDPAHSIRSSSYEHLLTVAALTEQ